MLSTPAPTTPGNSPRAHRSQLPETAIPDFNLGDNPYPVAPQNHGTAPFSILVGLFERLQNERKPEKRRKFLNAWFDVRAVVILEQSFRSRVMSLALAQGSRHSS